MTRWFRSLALALAVSTAAWSAADAQRYIQHVKVLAAPEMKGRGAGMPELDKAAQYLAREFEAAGLKPLNGGSFLQPFTLTAGATLGPGNHLEARIGDRVQSYKAGHDFLPFSFSSRDSASGGVVFAGYGITAPEFHYDDYTHLDVKDKIVLVLRHEPQEFDEKSVFRGKDFTQHAAFINKAINARNRGARALIVVNDRAAHPAEEDLLVKFGSTKGPEDAGIPILQIKAEIADEWLATAGKSLNELQAAIDKSLQSESVTLSDSLQIIV